MAGLIRSTLWSWTSRQVNKWARPIPYALRSYLFVSSLYKKCRTSLIGFTQSSYPAFFVPSDEDYKTHLIVMRVQRWDKSFMCANKLADFFSLCPPTRFIKMTKRQNTYLNTPVFRHAGQFFSGDALLKELKSYFFKLIYWIIWIYRRKSSSGKIFILEEISAIFWENERTFRLRSHHSRGNKGAFPQKMPMFRKFARPIWKKSSHTFEKKIGINLLKIRDKGKKNLLIPLYFAKFKKIAVSKKQRNKTKRQWNRIYFCQNVNQRPKKVLESKRIYVYFLYEKQDRRLSS